MNTTFARKVRTAFLLEASTMQLDGGSSPRKANARKFASIHSTLQVATVAALVLVALGVAAPSSARPDPGGAPANPYVHLTPGRCHLERIDRQLVRCDNLTGAGARAPMTVPQVDGSLEVPGQTVKQGTNQTVAPIGYASTLFATWGTVTKGSSSTNAAEQRMKLTGGHAGSANAAEAPAFRTSGG